MNDYQPYKSYTSYGDVMVAYSALSSGGFSPILQNLNAAQINMFQALAMGGYWIFLPENEHESARDWQDWLKQNAIAEDHTKVEPQSYWTSSILGSVLIGAVFVAPVLIMSAIFTSLKPKRAI